MNIQLSTLNRILIVGGLFVVILLLGYFFLIQPKKNQETSTRAEIADLQAQYDDLKRVADQKPLYLAFTDQIRQRLKGVEVTADPRLYVPSFLKQVEQLAGKDGLIITTVTPSATAAPSPGPSGSPTPGPVRAPNIPFVGGVANTVARGVGGQTAGSAATSPTVQGTTPVGATPIPGAPAPGVPAGGEENPAREAALAYLAQSFTQVPFSMEFDGHYDSLERFLRDLAKFQKLIGVGSVTIAPNGGNPIVGSSPRLKITLPIEAYRLSPNAPASGPLVLPSPTPKPGVKK